MSDFNGLEGEHATFYTGKPIDVSHFEPNPWNPMPLETASFPKDLVTSNPAASDGMNNADDHMRMIKACLKNALAGVNAALTRAVASTFALQMPSGTAADPSYSFSDETTLGFTREAAGTVRLVGGQLKNGAPLGSVHMFLAEPAGLGKGGSATVGNGPVGIGWDYLELDGSTWDTAAFPRLAQHLGVVTSTFTLIDMKNAGRFPRSRTATVPVLTVQASQNKTHVHAVSITSGNVSNDHTHTFSGTTSSMNRNNPHTHTTNAPANSGLANTGASNFALPQYANTAIINAADINHEHAFSGTTSGISSDHTHLVSGNTASEGGSEARPEALSFVFCIKT